MYKRKLFFFGMTTAFMLFIALICTAISAHLTREHLKQFNIAHSLLFEHQQLSSISYRLFKQLTDEVIFDRSANQAFVRNKQKLIAESFEAIKRLELEQRESLGIDVTKGSVEDTADLESLVFEIISEFQAVVADNVQEPLNQQERLRRLLEVTIDNQFREAINAALARQGRVVSAINVKIDTLNTTMVWFTFGLGALSIPLLIFGCYWLFNQLYQPLILIRGATNKIALGNYDRPISEKLDEEFDELAQSINLVATRLQQHEQDANTSRKQLEYEVEQRTRELTDANQQLTKVDNRRRQFLADVSHELRTPLTIIRGEAQVTLRMKSASKEDYKETLQSILSQSVNLSRLVDDLLLLTRAEMNQLNLVFAKTSLAMLVQEEVEKWQRLYPEREITLSSEGQEDMALELDKHRIQQALSILIDNAIKYSAEGLSVSVTLAAEQEFALISVADKGEGISAAEIENIFERFVRFSKHDMGVGLGLPIAKAIVEAHHGNISVESVQGEGSLFSIRLPLGDPS